MGNTGSKYHRVIYGLGNTGSVTVDVYSVLTAFGVTHPAQAHALKKLLLPGLRGKGSRLQDLIEARDALDRAIEDEEKQ